MAEGRDRTPRRVERRSTWYEDRQIEQAQLQSFPVEYTDLLTDRVFSNLVQRRLNLMISLEQFLSQMRPLLPEVASTAERILAR